MIILAIETSCDDTGVALVKASGKKKPRFKILSNIVSSQVKIHKKWGGVYPTLAKREHQKNLPLVLKRAFTKAEGPKVDLIAITIGPGLEPCLWVGVNFAKAQIHIWLKPIIFVNHIEAHIYANFLDLGEEIKNRASIYGSEGEEEDKVLFACQKSKIKNIFPAVCLVVSGGHTQLILMIDFNNYKILGETRDDAAGECFDKVAKTLGLSYPGGPAIAEWARQWKFEIKNPKSKILLPRPMIYQKNYDFSFSGLKTAVLYHFKNQSLKIRRSKKYIQTMSKEVQQAIIDVLIYKTLKAAKDYGVKTIILGGGVAANEELRKQFKEKIEKEIPNSQFFVPDAKFCTDNAVMVAITAYYHWLKEKGGDWKKLRAEANLKIS